jgi:hypothetical protein
MTATQVFYRFLKEELTINEFVFFNRALRGEKIRIGKGNSRPAFTRRENGAIKSKTFVEDFLAAGRGRSLNGYMSNLLKYLCPRLSYQRWQNVDYKRKREKIWYRGAWGYSDQYYFVYNELWHNFLKRHIENASEKIYDGRVVDYKLKKK